MQLASPFERNGAQVGGFRAEGLGFRIGGFRV